MPNVHCRFCKTKFSVRPYFVKVGWGKYCSLKCKNAAQREGKSVTCFTCRKAVYRSRADLSKSKSEKYFCNKSCQTIWRNSQYVGSKHLNWKGGFSSYAYRNLLKRTSKREVCGSCGITDKRVLVVHHKDRNHRNNKVNNLVWLCHNCHILHHRYAAR